MNGERLVRNLKNSFAPAGRWQLYSLACGLLICARLTHAQTVAADSLQFLDGSTLRGSLLGLDDRHTVRWQHPAAAAPIAFLPRNLHRLRFNHPAPALPEQQDSPACRLRFANGDEVVGDLISLDDKHVVFKTWFGGRITAPRESVRLVQFLKGRAATHYEGPVSLAEWTLGQPSGAWSFRDGVLSASQIGSIGRDVGLPPNGRLELDLDWGGQLSLLLSIYTDSTARFDFNASGYMFILGPGYVTLQRMQGIRGTTHMGQVAVPQFAEKNQAHVEFRASKDKGTLALLVDGVLMQQWTDPQGFAGTGTGLALLSQRVGPPVNLSNIRVSDWEDGLPVDLNVATNTTVTAVNLVNGDVARGEVRFIREGKVALGVHGRTLNVPAERVVQIHFPTGTNQMASLAGLVRAELHSGASVTFRVNQWTPEEVNGTSPQFGAVALKPSWIRQLVFNLDVARPDKPAAIGKDDFFWPFEP